MPEILNAVQVAQVLIAQKPGGHRASFVKVRLLKMLYVPF